MRSRAKFSYEVVQKIIKGEFKEVKDLPDRFHNMLDG
jgi:hypothetical protein